MKLKKYFHNKDIIKTFKNNFPDETEIFKKNSRNLNCTRHFKMFNEFKIIPKFCFSCYKVQITLFNVMDLIKYISSLLIYLLKK